MAILLLCLQVNFNNNVKMEFAYPLVNLSALHPGFFNPAEGSGIVGMPINPACISDIDKGQFFIAYTPSISSSFSSDFVIPIEGVGSVDDTIIMPVDFCFEDRGNIDLIGFGYRKDRWAFGLAVLRGDYLRLDLDGQATIDVRHDIEFDDTLTSELIEGLPPGIKIPVTILLSGEGNAMIDCSGEAKMKSQSFILSVGTKEAGMDVGVGLQVEPIWMSANVGGNVNGRLAGAATAEMNPHSSDWSIDAEFGGEIVEDSLVGGMLDAHLNGWLVRLVTGFKKNWRFLDVGLAYHLLFPPMFNGDLQYRYFYPESLPEIVIDDEDLIIDTVHNRITGKGKITIRDFKMEIDEEDKELDYLFSKAHGFYGGIGLKLFIIKFAVFGGALIVPDGSYTRLMGGANLGLKIFIPLNATVTVHYQMFTIDDIPITALPTIGANIGTNFKIKNIRTYIGAGLNSTQGAASVILPEQIEGKKTRQNIISIKTGLGYEF